MDFERFDKLARSDRVTLLTALELLWQNGRMMLQTEDESVLMAGYIASIGGFYTKAHQSGIFCGLLLDLLLDEDGTLFALVLPGQYNQMLVFRVVSNVRPQCVADIRYALKLLIGYHVFRISCFASLGENFTPVNPFTSQ